MSNTYTKDFQDGQALTEAQLNTAFTTIKPTIANLALSTTGSSSFQVLRSTGSNTAPAYSGIGDVLANGTMTAGGANAVINAVTSVSSTSANLIGNAINSATAANNIIDNATQSATSSSQGLLNRYQVQTIDLTGSGDFTGGTIKVERINDTITITALTNLTFTSSAAPDSDSGLIPAWAIPDLFVGNVNSLGTTVLFETQVETNGVYGFDFNNYSGGPATRTDTGSQSVVITYSVT